MVVLIHQKLCDITSHLTNVDNIPISVSFDILGSVNWVTVLLCLNEKYSCTFKKKIKIFFLYFLGL